MTGKQGDDFVLSNILSGKQFVMGDKSLEILLAFEGTRKLSDVASQFEDVSSNAFKGLFEYFIGNKLIYDIDDKEFDPSFEITTPNQKLFDLDYFNFSKEQKGVVFFGIPFGRGNTLSDNCELTPSIHRNFTKQFGLNFNQEKALNTFEALLPIKVNFDHLRQLIETNNLWDGGDLYLYNHEDVSDNYKKIEKLSHNAAVAGNFPYFIGGDHSITYPILKGLHQEYGKIVLIQLDAHTDTYSHGAEKAFPQRNHHHGNFVKFALESDILHSVHQFGVRGLSNYGQNPMYDNQYIYPANSIEGILNGSIPCDIPDGYPIYLTVDIDVLDPSISPGTPTPVPGGLLLNDTLSLIQKILADRTLVGADIVEIHNDRDKDNITLHTALLIELLTLNYFPIS